MNQIRSQLVLIRGVPGSGKTTMAGLEFPDYQLVEADDYFIDEKGLYRYNSNLLKQAHRYCQNKTFRSLSNGVRVVVANTFVKLWEIQPYISFADKNHIQYEIIEAKGRFKNIHGVPQSVISRMIRDWEVIR